MFQFFSLFIQAFVIPALLALLPLLFYLVVLKKKIKKLRFRRRVIVISLVALIHFLLALVAGYSLVRWLDDAWLIALLFFVVPGAYGVFFSSLIFLVATLFETVNLLANWINKQVYKKRAHTFFVLFILLLAVIVAELLRYHLREVL